MGRFCIKSCKNTHIARWINGAFYLRLLLFLACLIPNTGWCAPQLIDQIDAVVSGKPILRSTIDEKVAKGQSVLVSAYPAKESDSIREKAFQDEINLELVRQKAAEVDVGLDDQDVEEDIKKFLLQRRLEKADLLTALKQQGITYEQYKKDFRTQMLVQKFQGRVISPGIKITDKDLEALYLARNRSTAKGVTVALNRVAVEVKKPELPKGSRQLDKIATQLIAGKSFAEIQKEKGGKEIDFVEMPPLDLLDIAQPFRDAIAAKGVGEVTEVIQSENLYYLFQIRSKDFKSSGDFAKQKSELEYELRNSELTRQTLRWLADNRKSKKIQILDH